MTPPSDLDAAKDLFAYVEASPTPYHAVAECKKRLIQAGFRELDEREPWSFGAGDRVFVVRGGGTIAAFVGGGTAPSRAGFLLVGAHTDSPNFRVKPRGETGSFGQRQLGVEVYGSPLLHTWTDRDLSLAGRVSLLDGSTHLVRFDRPVCRISSLAIHLSPTLATDGLRLNPQQLMPTFALGDDDKGGFSELLASELGKLGLGAKAADVAAFDLALHDVQPPSLGGASGELVFSPRLDNLASCHAALAALTSSRGGSATRGIVLYDHEEVGSQSAAGAASLFLRATLERLCACYPEEGSDAGPRALARSLLVSADMAHAVHPNHADKHDAQHGPRLGAGPVIKVNASQSYATDAPGAALFERACARAGFAAQRFVSRNDMRCGSTIGPISAARLGVRTVDVGSPMLSMHSCREMAATADVAKMIGALSAVFAMEEVPAPAS